MKTELFLFCIILSAGCCHTTYRTDCSKIDETTALIDNTIGKFEKDLLTRKDNLEILIDKNFISELKTNKANLIKRCRGGK